MYIIPSVHKCLPLYSEGKAIPNKKTIKGRKEARKWAFKESIVCSIPTIFLTAIIMYFTMSKEFAAAPLTLTEMGVKTGGTVTVTSLACCFLQYLIVGKAFKAQFAEGGEKLPPLPRPSNFQFVKPVNSLMRMHQGVYWFGSVLLLTAQNGSALQRGPGFCLPWW